MSNSSIGLIDRTLSSTTTPSGHGSNGNEGIFQSSCIAGVSPSDDLESYQDTHWVGTEAQTRI